MSRLTRVKATLFAERNVEMPDEDAMVLPSMQTPSIRFAYNVYLLSYLALPWATTHDLAASPRSAQPARWIVRVNHGPLLARTVVLTGIDKDAGADR